jgi:energy-coupling factor transport system ATP-binding protein
VLLLDEPTAMLDASTAAEVRAVVAEVVARRGLTLVVVEHRLDRWLDLVDRIVVLDAQGAVVADGQPREVLARSGDRLAAQGIWVPGVPDPEPLQVSLPAAARGLATTSSLLARGRVVVSARDVEVEHHSRRLGARARSTLAVAHTDLDVHAGEALAVIGPSGAGKSTLMAAMGGLVAPRSGSVEMALGLTPGEAGEPRDRRRARERLVPPSEWRSADLARVVAWVPQRAASAIVGRTVRDDILTTPRALGLDRIAAGARSGDGTFAVGPASDRATEPERPVSRPQTRHEEAREGQAEGRDGQVEERVDSLLEALGLAHLADVDPRQLSGGEQRRLAMASAIAHSPALVLADEPTVGQDRLTWSAVTGVLEAARREGSAVVVTTHDPGVVERADRVVRLSRPAQPTADAEPERRPLLARVGPLALLLAALSVLPLPALLSSWRQGLAVLAVELVLAMVGLIAPGPGRRPTGRVRGVLARLAPAAIAVAGVAWSAWLLGGRDVEVAAGAALRVLCLIVPSAVVVGFIDPERLGDHLAQRLHLPARPVVAATAALQRVQAFDALWVELMTTRRVRGIRADTGVVARAREAVVVTGGLLVGALGQASNLALAMDARGFAEARRRTWAGDAPWRLADTLAVLAGLAIIAAGVAARLFLP